MQVVKRPKTFRNAGFAALFALFVGLFAPAVAVVGPGWLAAPSPAGAAVAPQVSSGGAPGVPNGGHSCAVLLGALNQPVYCWGFNSSGQLGDPSVPIGGHSNVPVQVQGLMNAREVSAGANHTCAVDSSHAVWCWGDNSFGELGNGTFNQSTTPVQVSGILATQVSAGFGFSCAVTLKAVVKCWGDGNDGELGNGTNSDSDTPVLVKNLSNVTSVAAGGFHGCALNSNGGMWCWGDNLDGQLGDGTTTGSNIPVPVSGLDAGVQQIAAGGEDSCAILIGGDLKCWGDNLYGELGIGTLSPTEETTPTQVASLTSGVDQVTLGFEHSCAIIATPGAEAVCWGNPEHGDIGNGQFGNKAMPFPTAVFSLLPSPTGQGGPDSPVQISAGYYHTCAALSSGAIACWGAGTFGEIGDGTGVDRSIPTRVIGLPASPATSNVVAGGGTAGCALDATLSVKCWGQYVGDGTNAVRTSATTVNNVPAGGIAQVSAGNGGCVLTQKGVVKCWGQNDDGQVGNGTMVSSPVLTPSTVSFPGSPKPYPQALTFSGYHACVTTNNGAGAYCWGANDKGQLGDGTTTNRDSPVAVTALSSGYIAQIAAGGKHTCVLLKNGTVQCWGYNHYGQLGNGSTSDSSTAVTVSGLSDIVQIAVGQEFSCALDGGGNVSCWGDGTLGQLGNGTSSSSDTPVAVSGIGGGKPAVAITGGLGHACAVLLSGSVDCWGAGQAGQLGDGSFAVDSVTPVAVSSFSSDGASISASSGTGFTTCALNSSEVAQCWGDNSTGELGDGSSGPGTNSDVPVTVNGL